MKTFVLFIVLFIVVSIGCQNPQKKKEMGIKFDLYEENEVKEYWIVDS